MEVIAQKIHPVDRDKKLPMLSLLIKENRWTQVLVFTAVGVLVYYLVGGVQRGDASI